MAAVTWVIIMIPGQNRTVTGQVVVIQEDILFLHLNQLQLPMIQVHNPVMIQVLHHQAAMVVDM
jgi:hypothetical protein